MINQNILPNQKGSGKKKQKKKIDRYWTWQRRRFPALRRFLAATAAAAFEDRELESLFFLSFLFFFLLATSSPFAIANSMKCDHNSKCSVEGEVYGSMLICYGCSCFYCGASIWTLCLKQGLKTQTRPAGPTGLTWNRIYFLFKASLKHVVCNLNPK